ncbi:MAG: sulfatase [Planctomycetaceae bacterium]|jgi:arylsulfatase A-like enzyme|nr:sulfatase [Planctomycetaceae bacterium]
MLLLYKTVIFVFCLIPLPLLAKELPNIIIIFIDDMGYADIAPFGGEIPTPHLDRMAKEGRQFTNFITVSPVCSASRAALLTGCLSRRVGIEGALGPRSEIGLNPAEETIAEVVKKRGYATAIFGKWHLGHYPEFLPPNQGFDEYFGLPYSNDMGPGDDAPYKINAPPLRFIEGLTVQDEIVTSEIQDSMTTQYTERAVRFIERNKDRPFFLYLPHNMVHVPLHVSNKFREKSGHGLFGDVVQEVDWSVGQILDTIRRLNLEKKTLVVFTADNGPWISYGSHAGSAKPLREGKLTSFEGGIREPTIFWLPETVPAGTTSDQLASTIDLLPTIARLIDVPLAGKKIDGKDIRPLILGTEGAVSPHETIPIYFGFGNGQLQAIRDNRWKLIFPHTYLSFEGKTGRDDGLSVPYNSVKTELALYDLQKDVEETKDLSSEYPEIVQRLQFAAENYRKQLGEGKQLGPEVRPPGKHSKEKN